MKRMSLKHPFEKLVWSLLLHKAASGSTICILKNVRDVLGESSGVNLVEGDASAESVSLKVWWDPDERTQLPLVPAWVLSWAKS